MKLGWKVYWILFGLKVFASVQHGFNGAQDVSHFLLVLVMDGLFTGLLWLLVYPVCLGVRETWGWIKRSI